MTGLFSPLHAETFRLALHHDVEAIYAYEVGLLKLALAKSGGDHQLEILPFSDSQFRTLRHMTEGTADFNILYFGYDREREEKLLQIPVPLTRGLLGHRVFVIRADNRSLFNGVESLETLTNRLIIGSGTTWPDTKILRRAGFRVETGSYDSLWRMLGRGRVAALSRGMDEVIAEIDKFGANDDIPLVMEQSVMLVYPYDHFFYVAKQDQRLADIVGRGLAAAYVDGSFMQYFNNFPAISRILDDMRIHPRTVFHLENPDWNEALDDLPAHYWFNMDEVRGQATEAE